MMYILPCNSEDGSEQVEFRGPNFEIDSLAFHMVKRNFQSSWHSHYFSRGFEFPRGDSLLESVFSFMLNTLLYFKIRKLPCPSIFIKRFYNLCFNGWVVKTIFMSIP